MRIRLETDAVQLIIGHVRPNDVILITSIAHDVEIAASEDAAEREHLQLLIKETGKRVSLDLVNARERAERLTHAGLGGADAAHLAFAEQAGADFVILSAGENLEIGKRD